MKKLLLFILPLTIYGESSSKDDVNGSDFVLDPKHPVVQLLSEIHLGDNDTAWLQCHEQYSQSANLIRSKFLIPYLEYQAAIINHKKFILEKEHKLEKAEIENEFRLKMLSIESKTREMQIAEYYHSSQTAKIDGRTWYELTESERKKHRERFVRYHNSISNLKP